MKSTSGDEHWKKQFLVTKDKIYPFSRVVKKLKHGLVKVQSISNHNPEARYLKTQANEQKYNSGRYTLTQQQHSYSMDRSANLHSSMRADNNQKLELLHKSLAKDCMNKLEPIQPNRNTIQVNANVERRRNQRSIESIEKQLDYLLQEKIKLLIESNKARLNFRHSGMDDRRGKINQQMDQLNKQLKQLLRCFKDNEDIEGPSTYKKWKVLDNKLLLLEKTLAQSKTELEIMRNYYAFFANNRTEYKQMSIPLKRTQFRESFQQSGGVRLQQDQLSPLKTKFPFELASTNEVSYKAPTEGDYEKYRYKQPDYEMNPRPLPSSSYKESYQNYPGLRQHYFSAQKDQLTRLGPFNVTIRPKNCEVSQKKAERTNYKDLDCYVDKFKNLKVSYINKPEKPSQDSNAEFAKLQRLINRGHKHAQRNNKSLQHELISTSQDNYRAIDEDDQRIFRNQPKNSRLDNFAAGFRSLANQ